MHCTPQDEKRVGGGRRHRKEWVLIGQRKKRRQEIKQIWKKPLSWLLSTSILLSLSPAMGTTAFAEDGDPPAASYAVKLVADPADGGTTGVSRTEGSNYAPALGGVVAGETVYLKAEAAEGYEFTAWTAPSSVTIADPAAKETSFEMPDLGESETGVDVKIRLSAGRQRHDPRSGGSGLYLR